jgi:archaemetzincin
LKENKIILLSCGSFEKKFLGRIVLSTEAEFHIQVTTEECRMDLDPYYNPGRRQYDGNRLLRDLPLCTASEYGKLLGLYKVDLFIPILTYIFGQAMLNHQAAIASVYRLRNELYGLKQDEDLLLSRTVKEVIHELGHTFGLIHCHVPSCVMRSSTYVEDIDQKSSNLCTRCQVLFEERQK